MATLPERCFSTVFHKGGGLSRHPFLFFNNEVDMLNPNSAAFAVGQRIPVMLVGGSGVGKTTLAEACANAMGRWFHPFLPSHHLPEEVSGIPVVYREEEQVRMLVLDWMKRFQEKLGYLFLDEINTGSSSMLALLLSVIQERRIGNFRLSDDLVIMAAMNPPHLAPNAIPLPASVRNRFCFWDWRTPVTRFLQGIEHDNFPQPSVPVVQDAEIRDPHWGRLVKAFLESRPGYVEHKVVNDENRSFASLRTWRMVKLACAALDSIAADPNDYLLITNGCVGDEASSLFHSFVADLDLYPAREVILGNVAVNLDDSVDRLLPLPGALVFHARRMNEDGELLPDQIQRCFELMVNLGERGLVDAVVKPMTIFAKFANNWRPDLALQRRFGALLQQIRVN